LEEIYEGERPHLYASSLIPIYMITIATREAGLPRIKFVFFEWRLRSQISIKHCASVHAIAVNTRSTGSQSGRAAPPSHTPTPAGARGSRPARWSRSWPWT
jgi:hypothetical protein